MPLFMGKLDDNWLTQPSIDYEYKKYVLLAYIQRAERELEQLRLYPTGSDALQELNRIQTFLTRLSENESSLPRELVGVDLQSKQLDYQSSCQAPEAFQIITSVAEYACERLTKLARKVAQLRSELLELIVLEPIGLLSPNPLFGYLFIEGPRQAVQVYEYEPNTVSYRTDDTEPQRIKTTYYSTFSLSIANTFEHIKTTLVLTGNIGNPATFLVRTQRELPLNETVLPLATVQLQNLLK